MCRNNLILRHLDALRKLKYLSSFNKFDKG
jgi:hypothetical protein